MLRGVHMRNRLQFEAHVWHCCSVGGEGAGGEWALSLLYVHVIMCVFLHDRSVCLAPRAQRQQPM